MDSSERKVIELLAISLFRENNFTSSNQIYILRNSGLHATEYPLQHNLQGYGIYRLQSCIPALSCDEAKGVNPSQKVGGGGTDSKLGRSGGMLPETCFLILVH